MKEYAISAALAFGGIVCMGDDLRGIAVGIMLIAAAGLVLSKAGRDRSE